MKIPLFPFLIFALSLPLFLNAEARRIDLGPISPALSNDEVPFLHEVMSEHHLSNDDLSLIPEGGLYEWTKSGPTTEPFRLRIKVGEAKYEHATLSVWNWHNHLVQQTRFSAGTDEIVEFAITGLGSYLVTLDGWREGAYRERLIRNFAVIPDNREARDRWKTEEFFVGICAFPGRYHWKPDGQASLPTGLTEQHGRDREAALMARLGLQVVRTDESLEMGHRKNSAGDPGYIFDFSRMDAAVGAYTSRGFQLALQTMSAADWAVLPSYAEHGKNRWRYPHREHPQRAYVAALVERYHEKSRFVQVSNEPDQIGYWSGTNEEFVTQYTYSREEIRQIAPDLPITQGGYSLVDEEKCAFLIRQLHPAVDFPAYNAHGNLEDYKRSFATMKRLQAEAGDSATGWINTEMGYSAWRLEQERRQAQIDPQKVLYSWANGHAGVLVFCSRMTRPPGRDGSPDFGLLDHQYCPRFVYNSLATLIKTLQGATFRETLIESDNVHLYVFARDGDLIVAGFTIGEATVTATLQTDAREILTSDEMGNTSLLAGAAILSLSLDHYPRYWLLRDATAVRLP